jgi:hypothetical protein
VLLCFFSSSGAYDEPMACCLAGTDDICFRLRRHWGTCQSVLKNMPPRGNNGSGFRSIKVAAIPTFSSQSLLHPEPSFSALVSRGNSHLTSDQAVSSPLASSCASQRTLTRGLPPVQPRMEIAPAKVPGTSNQPHPCERRLLDAICVSKNTPAKLHSPRHY